MMIVMLDRETEKAFDADQGKIEPDGTLNIFQWLRLGPYRCPLHKTIVATFAPGMWASFFHQKDSE